ncbi:MAG: hypothetical protein AAB578_06485 [Elusimicrobiota bacterium]
MLLWSFCLAVSVFANAGEFERLRPADFISPASSGAETVAPPPVVPIPAPGVPQPDPQTPIDLSGRFTVAPDLALTPGRLCTMEDKDFFEYRYPEKIPYCKRNLSTAEKKVVSKWYGVRWEDHGLYQYDHLFSLCLGGSNHLRNIWPMLWDEARKKAMLEADLCRRLEKGQLTQKAAVAEELSWFKENRPDLLRRFYSAIPAHAP